MTGLIAKGGIMMYPILISSVIAFAVIIERIYIFFIRTKFLNREKISEMFLLTESGRKDKALEILEKEPSIFASLFISILKEKSISDMEEAALLTGEEILFYLKRRLSLLSVLGSILPLMGLLGTVLGMIKVFTKVANAGNAADISILAGGIWEALITTAAGMIYAMATDYRIAVNNPKIKVGMTEIKIGLSLSPSMGNVMRFGLDTDRNYRDIIMKGELVDPAFCVERGIVDEHCEAEELIEKAKAKVVALYDTLMHPFTELKNLQKRDMAALIKRELGEYDWNIMGDTFMDERVKKLLGKVLAQIS